MEHMPELAAEREFTAKVQRLLLAVIERADMLSGSHLNSIREIIADAWEELRLRPTELSTQEMEQLSGEVDRFAARRDFAITQSERYRKMLMEPFFARVDFMEQGEEKVDRIMIGLYSLTDEQGNLLIHDWRAPVCSLYYDAMPGEAGYDCPEGRIMGTLSLKRQYRMENGQLKYYVDTQLSIEDGMLLDLLSSQSDRHMKQIASTIQQEQNAAVRCDNAKAVCVVGGAGSGKTSVAMHRAAFLMYRQRNVLDASRILIISPGTAFSEYVSNVLPELGEDNIGSKTMRDIVGGILKCRLEPPAHRVEQLLLGEDDLRRVSTGYKSTPEFLEQLRAAANTFASMGPTFGSVRMDDKIMIHKDELRAMYQNEFRLLSPAQRIERMKATLESRLENWTERLAKQYEHSYADKYTGRALKTAVQLAVSRQMQPIRTQLKRYINVTGDALYQEVMRRAPAQIRKTYNENRESGVLWWEDAVAEAFLMVKLGFVPQDKHIYHVLIDEAQDYSDAELALIHECYPNAHVTILGDPRQRTCPGMPPCDPKNWENCFEAKDVPIFELTRCYRSTRQIAEFCNRILPENETEMIPFGRDGEAPLVAEYTPDALSARLDELRSAGFDSIAVLTRTQSGADILSEKLDNVYRLDGGEEDLNYEAGDNVVASYNLVKGMEFDAVIVVWPDAELTDGERRRIYTSCTRALHSVTVLTEGRLLKTLEALK